MSNHRVVICEFCAGETDANAQSARAPALRSSRRKKSKCPAWTRWSPCRDVILRPEKDVPSRVRATGKVEEYRNANAYSLRQLLANACIAASRVGSYPCAARLTVAAEWPLAHIQGRPCGAVGTVKMRPTTTPFSKTL
jgi:hypothetical protein